VRPELSQQNPNLSSHLPTTYTLGRHGERARRTCRIAHPRPKERREPVASHIPGRRSAENLSHRTSPPPFIMVCRRHSGFCRSHRQLHRALPRRSAAQLAGTAKSCGHCAALPTSALAAGLAAHAIAHGGLKVSVHRRCRLTPCFVRLEALAASRRTPRALRLLHGSHPLSCTSCALFSQLPHAPPHRLPWQGGRSEREEKKETPVRHGGTPPGPRDAGPKRLPQAGLAVAPPPPPPSQAGHHPRQENPL
jgi:hypothetical protein